MYSNSKFINYIKSNKIKPIDFAKDAGISWQSVYNYMNNHRRPDDEAKFKIAKATRGAVLPNDWFNLSEIF